MLTAISPGQWQPWTAVSPLLGAHQHGIAVGSMKGKIHFLGDMAVRMRQVLARPWVAVYVALALSLSYYRR